MPHIVAKRRYGNKFVTKRNIRKSPDQRVIEKLESENNRLKKQILELKAFIIKITSTFEQPVSEK